ncbi:MAG TPA: DUF3106 domain-containing protein [Edaphobacter sp.]
MRSFASIRQEITAAAALALLAFVPAMAHAQKGGFGGRGGAFAQPRVQARAVQGQKSAQPQQSQKQEHLAQWMERHNNLPPAEQQKALESEPGFKDLPQETQQRMRDSLNRLNNMSPEQRRRALARTEAMEHLTPQQRSQVRGALGQLGSLPMDRRRLVARAFRDLREMPEPQRQAILSSDRFKSQFSDQERGTLSNLLSVEPYLPVQKPSDGVEAGKQ